MTKEYDFFTLLNNYISECESGKHLLKNGSKMREGSINNYKSLNKLLIKFCTEKKVTLKITNLIKCSQREYVKEKNQWKKVYNKLTQYMYSECNHYDNYVGATMKLIRSFFNYLKYEKGIDCRDIPKMFYVTKEEVPIVVLSQEQLKFLIFNKEFEASLCRKLQKAKDTFVFGCAVGLRISDLKLLSKRNVEKNYRDYYIKVFSKKTSTFTRIKLPEYAVDILKKYEGKIPTLLPHTQLIYFNRHIKEIAEKAGWTYFIDKTRSKRGSRKIIKKTSAKNKFRFCDLITSHTMRRTAITTYLSLGMPEQLVRRISGHSSGSKEFFRYVKFSEELLENEMKLVHEKFLSFG
jgi:integrase